MPRPGAALHEGCEGMDGYNERCCPARMGHRRDMLGDGGVIRPIELRQAALTLFFGERIVPGNDRAVVELADECWIVLASIRVDQQPGKAGHDRRRCREPGQMPCYGF